MAGGYLLLYKLSKPEVSFWIKQAAFHASVWAET